MIWTTFAVVVLLWPVEGGSLVIRTAHFVVDPTGELPTMPPPLSLMEGDNGDAVMAHDAQQNAYYDAYESSALTRARMRVRDWHDPLPAGTQRDLLLGLAVFAALLVWRLDAES